VRLKPVAAPFLLIFALGAGPILAADKPQEIGAAFCEARLRGDDRAMHSLLSPSLQKAVEEAEARNRIIAEATPDEKPPFGDGIPYQSFPDQAPVCKVGEVRDVSGHAEVEIDYAFPETPSANWTDRLKLLPQAEGFLIDDILFADVANGTPNQGLRRILFEAFDQ
jgi:hypothetical protein